MSVRINVVEYDDEWPIEFERIKNRIWPDVKDIALRIEHVGSTSVPGLASKPVIDMDIVVNSLESSIYTIKILSRLGYIPLGTMGVPGREAFKRPVDSPKHNLYVCLEDSTAFENHIILRDTLRRDFFLKNQYSQLKFRLAEEFAGNIDGYCDAKTSFILGILKRNGFTGAELSEIAGTNMD